MTDNSMHRAVPERQGEPEDILDQVLDPERSEVAVIVRVPSRRASISSLIGSDHVEPRRCERHHDFAPAVGEFWEAMKQDHTRPATLFKARLEQVHPKPIVVVHEARADGLR